MKKMTFVAGLLASLFLVSCANQTIRPADVTEPATWGASDNVVQLRHLYFSEQPDAETLRIAQSRGVTTVINMRDPGELDWDEKAAAEAAGLQYINIPIAKQASSFDAAAIDRISAVVRESKGQPILLHCSSGNRAAGWLAIHLVEAHNLSEAQALRIASKAGLTSEVIESRVRNYLNSE